MSILNRAIQKITQVKPIDKPPRFSMKLIKLALKAVTLENVRSKEEEKEDLKRKSRLDPAPSLRSLLEVVRDGS